MQSLKLSEDVALQPLATTKRRTGFSVSENSPDSIDTLIGLSVENFFAPSKESESQGLSLDSAFFWGLLGQQAGKLRGRKGPCAVLASV